MERAEWLKRMRSMAEILYDRLAPQYWVTYGFGENETHREYLQKFLERVRPDGAILSAGCGAGRYDGLLLQAAHPVVGIDQSEGMLKRAWEHFPQVRYEKMGLQEISFRAEFDGVICIDALEHICPEEYPSILKNFFQALKPGGWLYFTVDNEPSVDLETSYRRAKERGLPVVMGEVVDGIEADFAAVTAMEGNIPTELSDPAVYHYYPALEQVRGWLANAGLSIEMEGDGNEYHHILAYKPG